MRKKEIPINISFKIVINFPTKLHGLHARLNRASGKGGGGKNHVHPIGELEENVMDVTVGIIYNYPISGKQVGLFQT